MQTSIIYESCDTLRDTVFARMSLFADLYIFPVQERLFQNVIFIGNLDVLPLISPSDIASIDLVTLVTDTGKISVSVTSDYDVLYQ